MAMATARTRDVATVMQNKGLMPTEALKDWHFDFSVINDDERLNESFKLRYEVYCNERQFLRCEDYPTKLEIDPFDAHSIHVGGHNQDGVMIGTVRLVLSSPIGFPLFEHCELFPEYDYLRDKTRLLTCAEISRLAISKMYRRRQNDGLYGLEYRRDFDPELAERPAPAAPVQMPEGAQERRNKPEIILGLYKGMYQQSKRQGITHWFVAMEKTLLRLLHRFNFDFTPIGPELDYYGPVVPYIAVVADIEEVVCRKNPDLFLEFMVGLEPEFLPQCAKDLIKSREIANANNH